MRLKKIRLAGFKSFVDPTQIPFPDDMTAIVGPNGCGKSNVIDAVRWVLGESSAKNLRGDAMTDVIFNGSSSRRPVSQCSVELVFDNSSQRIQGEYAGYQELSIKRVVTRDAQSTYYLNNTKCRRRDVTDLFLGTGLGPRSYAIIEQGMISRLIESKPHELRVFIEEAAGVSKYKERRRETENRIRHTRENLDRLSDVRSELGQQLEKLQRQAAAANRYKELKAKERRLKAELATIRWLHHGDKIAELEQQIQQQEADIEAYIAKQRGDEREITQLKEQQNELKQAISDNQHQYYLAGNEITRLEQNQHHSKQRREQINRELSRLAEETNELAMQLEVETELQQQLVIEAEEIEPNYLICEEQVGTAEQSLAEKEESWLQQQKQWRNQDQQFLHVKQQAQSRHSQIQSLLQVQLRTEQSIRELQQQIKQLEDGTVSDEVTELKQQKSECYATTGQLQAEISAAEQDLELRQQNTDALRVEWRQAESALQATQSKLAGLSQLQASLAGSAPNHSEWLAQQPAATQALWQYLEVEDGWQLAVQTTLQQWPNAQVIAGLETEALPQGIQLFFSNNMTDAKPQNSLAAKCRNQSVPEWLTRIEVVASKEQALALRPTLRPGTSLITPDGTWLGTDWLVNGLADGQQNQLQLKDDISALQQGIINDQDMLELAKQAYLDSEQVGQKQQQALKLLQQDAQENQLQLKHLDNQLDLLRRQMQSDNAKKQQLSGSLERQQEQLLEEKMQLEELAMQVEELESELALLQEQQDNIEQQREQQESNLQMARDQVQVLKNQLHEQAMRRQSLRHQISAVAEKIARFKQEVAGIEHKKLAATAELEELILPLEQQQEQLQILLQQQEELDANITQQKQQLGIVEQSLKEAEKSQHDVMAHVAKMQEQVQALRLQCERHRERSQAFIEQLQEMQQALKSVLQELPESYSEQQWQSDLEKTANALSRLGAVNLAAVEEYQVQAERKQHLDTQNDDLVAAMETLETAIRKIDKETRNRFKETFDRVNHDVKSLFPKVFGGGAAYLELTGEDLLETGVTIMARPPGKKNSTIHLLSGGEKALTALSLVFAIFRLNPAPFCLLDEVDAPLDDANVGRFCKLVSEMSKTVQFIYITHNKIAMEMALHLTGVTMAEPGVSRIVAVDVEEAVAIANA